MKTKENEGKNKGGNGVDPADIVSVVSAYVAVLPIFRRLQRVYGLRDLSISLFFLMAHNGAMSPYGLMMAYYGYNPGKNAYRSIQRALEMMRGFGLVVNGGGKWWLTEKGKRAILGED